MLEGLKPGFNALLRKPARAMAAVGLHPNHLTVIGLVLFGAAGWFSAYGHWIAAMWCVIGGGLMDSMDGLLARETGKKSVFGAILDSSSDRLTEILLLFGLTVFYASERSQFSLGVYFCYTAITGSIMVSYVKARCEGAGVKCSRGLLQRPERVILLAAGLLLGQVIMGWLLLAMSVLAAVTVAQRLREAALGSRELERAQAASTAQPSNNAKALP